MKIIFIILLFVSGIAYMQATEIYGIIGEDTTIGPEGNPWYVTSSLWIEETLLRIDLRIFTVLGNQKSPIQNRADVRSTAIVIPSGIV